MRPSMHMAWLDAANGPLPAVAGASFRPESIHRTADPRFTYV